MQDDMMTISINNWEKHNQNRRKGYRYFTLENRFFEDSKITKLCPIDVLLFIKCLSIAAELNTNQIQIHAGMMPKRWRIAAQSLLNRCMTLQSFQLVTIENGPTKGIERKGKERKRIERKGSSDGVTNLENQDLNKNIWTAYEQSYLLRYGIKPVRNAKVNANISQLGKRVGGDAVELVKFFLQHNDSFYLKTSHNISFCLRDCESLYTQFKRNTPITTAMVRSFEKHSAEAERQRLIDSLWDEEKNVVE